MKNIKSLILVFNFLNYANAAIHNVPSAFATISSALNVCQNYDTVLVESGIYFENIQWPSIKGIRLLSVMGRDSTIIDGGNLGRVIYISGSSISDSTIYIKGFTIQNGNVSDSTTSSNFCTGAGIFLMKCNIQLDDLIIKNNTLYCLNHSYGSGIYSESSDLKIKSCLIEENSIAMGTWSYGAGIYATGSELKINDSQILNNQLVSSSWAKGSGIYSVSSNVIIDLSNISSNVSTSQIWNGGTGIFMYYGSLIASSSEFKSNIQHTTGFIHSTGGALDLHEVQVDLSNLLIADNELDIGNTYGYGAGLNIDANYSNNVSAVVNCTFANNISGSNLFNSVKVESLGATIIFTNCILWSQGSGSEIQEHDTLIVIRNCDIKNSTLSGTNGNISLNPKFVSSTDYHLQFNSPCVNAGMLVLNNDLEYNLRPLPAGSNSDIGCYEMDEVLLGFSKFKQDARTIYPNPVGNNLNVDIIQPYSFEIYNLNGQIEIKGFVDPERNHQIDLTSISDGFYLIKIFSEEGKMFTRKFVKNGN